MSSAHQALINQMIQIYLKTTKSGKLHEHKIHHLFINDKNYLKQYKIKYMHNHNFKKKF